MVGSEIASMLLLLLPAPTLGVNPKPHSPVGCHLRLDLSELWQGRGRGVAPGRCRCRAQHNPASCAQAVPIRCLHLNARSEAGPEQQQVTALAVWHRYHEAACLGLSCAAVPGLSSMLACCRLSWQALLGVSCRSLCRVRAFCCNL